MWHCEGAQAQHRHEQASGASGAVLPRDIFHSLLKQSINITVQVVKHHSRKKFRKEMKWRACKYRWGFFPGQIDCSWWQSRSFYEQNHLYLKMKWQKRKKNHAKVAVETLHWCWVLENYFHHVSCGGIGKPVVCCRSSKYQLLSTTQMPVKCHDMLC